MEPAAALRGLAKVLALSLRRRSFNAMKSLRRKMTSPRTSRRSGNTPRKVLGRLRTVRMASVTTSPTSPSPRVKASVDVYKRQVYTFEVTEEDGERTITGRDHFSPKPMSPDEAAMQLDAQDFEFLTFLNSENDRINVIYRRKNGNLGLIDPIF